MINCQDKEFVCITCKTNLNIEEINELEKNAGKGWNGFVPTKLRVLEGDGVIFTNNSIFFDYHIVRGTGHKWGKYDDMIQWAKDIQEKLLNNLPKSDKVI